MPSASPSVIVLAGPNGAGKTTAARTVLDATLQVRTFVNADTIAQGLAGFDPDSAAVEAGRIMLTRLRELAEERADFAFESTLAGRTLAGWLAGIKRSGYAIHLLYFSLDSVELSFRRVAQRVAQGGHDIPEETIRRRFVRSMQNFQQLYLPLATTWRVYNNSAWSGPVLLASGNERGDVAIDNSQGWQSFLAAGAT